MATSPPTGRTTNLLSPFSAYAEISRRAPAHPLAASVSGADTSAVRNCVEALDAGQKQAIALAFFQGLSHSELSRQLRQPLGTVKSWVRRGLERLRDCLDRAGVTR